MRSVSLPAVSLPAVMLLPLTLSLAACGNKIANNGTIADTGTAVDVDGDGSPQSEDCDDGDASAYPGALEVCDGVDNDCDGLVDNGADGASTWYSDVDGDGYGDDDTAVSACDQPDGAVAQGGDCDDGDVAFHPDATEDDCTDPNDYNCDGSSGYADADGDGVAACEDCDDSNAAAYPDAPELCDGVDNDCDSLVDADDSLAKGEGGTWYTDGDGDGFGDAASPLLACEQPEGSSADDTDCDDANLAINPDATEVCNGDDDDCDTLIDDADDSLDTSTQSAWYVDADADGYGDDATAVMACQGEAGTTTTGGDCNDRDGAISPDAAEVCDLANVDEDCDGAADDADASATGQSTWYIDYDSDGFGARTFTQEACDEPSGYVAAATDCDDTDGAINPDATEICDGVDNDCDTLIDDADDSVTGMSTWYADSDADGYGDRTASATACTVPAGYTDDSTDCDDGDGAVNPAAAEVCDSGIDNDCNGVADDADAGVTDPSTWYDDVDGDGYGDPSVSVVACVPEYGFTDNALDCDDLDSTQNPDGTEVCNSEDDDCDGSVDEDATDGSWSYTDADGDGFGDPSSGSEWICGATIDNELDCDDTDATEPVVVSTSGSTSGAGTIDSPLSTIQAGIDASYACVAVEAGTYTEAIDFGGKDLEVSGIDGAATTIIDATGLGVPAVTFSSYETSAATLSGFTITGGDGLAETSSASTACTSVTTCTTTTTTYCGGGVLVDASGPTLQDLVISDNVLAAYSSTTSGTDTTMVYSYGGGLCALNSSSPGLVGVTLQGNFADQGGGVYVDELSSVSLDQTWLIENTATDGAGIQIDGGDAQLDNVASLFNVATDDAGGLLSVGGSVVMTNVTLAGDQGGLSGAIYASGASSAQLLNSIVYLDSSVAAILGDSTATFSVTYSDVINPTGSAWSGVTDPTGTSGNISSDPSFTALTDDGDVTNDDLSLATGSVAIDAGNPDTAYNDQDGSRNDMGAFGGPNGTW